MDFKLPAAYGGGQITSKGAAGIDGPTTKSTQSTQDSYPHPVHSYGIGVPEDYFPVPVEEGPLAETMQLVQMQERALLIQASRCRAAVYRLGVLQRIMQGRGGESRLKPKDVMQEIAQWKSTTIEMQRQLGSCLNTVGRDVAMLLGEKAPSSLPAYELKPHEMVMDTKDGPTVRKKDGSLATKTPEAMLESVTAEQEAEAVAKVSDSGVYQQPISKTWSDATHEQPSSISPAKDVSALARCFAPDIEAKYRVSTYHGVPVYGALPIPAAKGMAFEYPGDSELHLVWDVDQTKLVGEGTNDVELVIKCVLWWKEELTHDPNFVPSKVPAAIKKEFKDYCDNFDLQAAFKKVIHLLVRPGAKDFVKAHPQAKWWTFTNKDRAVDGQVVRDVSDEDGLVGIYQPAPHEVSGKKVVDANKYALRVLDAAACDFLGIRNQERPIIGVRGQRKDLARVAKLIKEKRSPLNAARPATIILIDDRNCDAYGKCQVNDERMLCHVPAHNAVSEDQAAELKAAMESILPVDTLLRFYQAFRAADPAHALIQCVDIMSDDQSMLLKKKGPSKDPYFEYLPKSRPAQDQVPPLPILKRDHCRKW